MAKQTTGTVVEKAYHPPIGAPDKYWCFLIVETKAGERVNIRLHQKIHDKITTGDAIRFNNPWRKNKRVKNVQLIG